MENYTVILNESSIEVFQNFIFKLQDGGYHVNGPLFPNGTEKDPNDDLKNIIPLGSWV